MDDKKPLSFGLDGMLRGLGTLLQVAADASAKDVRTAYGVSVRVGATRPAAPRRTIVEEAREPMTDVFDEGDHYLVVAELPGVDEAAVHWSMRGEHVLIIGGRADGRRYHRETTLPERVGTTDAEARFENGVLELRLWKQR